jgi:hypothetical protein
MKRQPAKMPKPRSTKQRENQMPHDEGPWMIGDETWDEDVLNQPSNRFIEVRKNDYIIALVQVDQGDAVQEDNLSLIVTAPDLLAALKGMVAMVEAEYGGFDAVPEWQVATEAINKAEEKVKR